eukprot:EG_transcript_8488
MPAGSAGFLLGLWLLGLGRAAVYEAPTSCQPAPNRTWRPLTFALGGAVLHQDQAQRVSFCVTTEVLHDFCDVGHAVVTRFNPDQGYTFRLLSPAVFQRANGDLVGVFRPIPDRKPGVRNRLPQSFLVWGRLNATYHLQPPLRGVAIPAPRHRRYNGPVDPRLFELRGRLFMLFEMQGSTSGWAGNTPEAAGGTYLWDLDDDGLVNVRLWRDGHPVPQARRDKNWVPLVVEDRLLVVRNYDPLQVLCCDPAGDCTFLVDQQGPQEGPTRVVRGGTPLLPYRPPYYVGLAHSNFRGCDGRRWYQHQLLVLNAEGTPRVLYVSDPVVLRMADGLRRRRVYDTMDHFCFPLGAVLRSPDVLEYGVHCDDERSYAVRLRGLAGLLGRVLAMDGPGRSGPRPGAVQDWYATLHRRECGKPKAERFAPDTQGCA